MFCPSCGKAIPDGSAFCPECGERIAVKAAPAYPERNNYKTTVYPQQPAPVYAAPAPKKKKKAPLIITLVVLLLLICGGAGAYFMDRSGFFEPEDTAHKTVVDEYIEIMFSRLIYVKYYEADELEEELMELCMPEDVMFALMDEQHISKSKVLNRVAENSEEIADRLRREIESLPSGDWSVSYEYEIESDEKASDNRYKKISEDLMDKYEIDVSDIRIVEAKVDTKIKLDGETEKDSKRLSFVLVKSDDQWYIKEYKIEGMGKYEMF